MLVKDFLDNVEFDINCYCDVYDCTDCESWHEANVILTAYDHVTTYPLGKIDGYKIKYITTNNDRIVIEATL